MGWYPAMLSGAAPADPVSLAEAKIQTRVDGFANDPALSLYIASARAHVEAYCGTPISQRTVTVRCDSFDDFASFPVVPLSSVSSIVYVDGSGADQTLSTDVYDVRSDGLVASIALKSGKSWPSIQTGSRITITAVVGYATVPDDIKHAMLLLIGHWFENREASGAARMPIPMGFDDLLTNHRSHAGA